MTEEQIALARRAVACKGWWWMPGMRWVNDPAKPLTSEGDEGRHEYGYTPPKYGIPDLTDPATLGCLLALVREAWGDSGMFVRPRGSKMRPDWAVFTGANSDIVCAALSEAEALVAALEAAP